MSLDVMEEGMTVLIHEASNAIATGQTVQVGGGWGSHVTIRWVAELYAYATVCEL